MYNAGYMINDYVPNDILLSIFKELDAGSLGVVSSVCKRWSEVVATGEVWRNAYFKYFCDLALMKGDSETWKDYFKRHESDLRNIPVHLEAYDNKSLIASISDLDIFMHLENSVIKVSGKSLSVCDLVQCWFACGASVAEIEANIKAFESGEKWKQTSTEKKVMVYISVGKFYTSVVSGDASEELLDTGIKYLNKAVSLIEETEPVLGKLLSNIKEKEKKEGTRVHGKMEEQVREFSGTRLAYFRAVCQIYELLGEAHYIKNDTSSLDSLQSAHEFYKRSLELKSMHFSRYHIAKAQPLMCLSGVHWRRALYHEETDPSESYNLKKSEELMQEAWMQATMWVSKGAQKEEHCKFDSLREKLDMWADVYTVAEILAGLGNIAHTKGNTQVAILYHKRAVTRTKRLWGPSHPLTLFHLAQLFDVLEEPSEEKDLCFDEIKSSPWWENSQSRLLGKTFLYPAVFCKERWMYRIFEEYVYQ